MAQISKKKMYEELFDRLHQGSFSLVEVVQLGEYYYGIIEDVFRSRYAILVSNVDQDTYAIESSVCEADVYFGPGITKINCGIFTPESMYDYPELISLEILLSHTKWRDKVLGNLINAYTEHNKDSRCLRFGDLCIFDDDADSSFSLADTEDGELIPLMFTGWSHGTGAILLSESIDSNGEVHGNSSLCVVDEYFKVISNIELDSTNSRGEYTFKNGTVAVLTIAKRKQSKYRALRIGGGLTIRVNADRITIADLVLMLKSDR